jgi:hypothetical protein
MTYRLRDGLSFCWIDGSAIFLDSERDRYFTLTGDAANTLRTLGEGGAADCDDIKRLVGMGLIRPSNGQRRPIKAEQRPTPARSLMDSPAPRSRSGLSKAVHVAQRIGQARRKLARTPLGDILGDLRRRKPQAAITPPSAAMLERVAAFNRARAHVPLQSRCLPDSLALIEDLATEGFHPDLVFGVRLSPFGAHCWVQAGDIALNDALDRIRVHTPILVV